MAPPSSRPFKEDIITDVLRPPIARERLEQRPDGLVRITLKEASPTERSASTWTRCRCSAAWRRPLSARAVIHAGTAMATMPGSARTANRARRNGLYALDAR